MPPKWTRKISRANPGAYYWNTNNIRGSYVPEPPGATWREENAQREWNAKMVKNAKNSVSLKREAFTPRARKWGEWVFGSPASVAPAPPPPTTNPVTLAGIKAEDNAQRAPDINHLNGLSAIGIEFMNGKAPKTTFTQQRDGNIPRLTGSIIRLKEGLKEPGGVGAAFDKYFDVLKRGSGVSDAKKAEFIRHILLLNRLLDGRFTIEYGGGMFTSPKNILDGFSPKEIQQLKAGAERVLAFARDENSEVYILEEYRIEAAERGKTPAEIDDYIARTVADTRAAAAPRPPPPPSAAELEAARIRAENSVNLGASSEAGSVAAAAAAILSPAEAEEERLREAAAAASEAAAEAAEERLREAAAAVSAAQAEYATARGRGRGQAAAAAKLKLAKGVAAAAFEAARAARAAAPSSGSSVVPSSSASSVTGSLNSSISGTSPLGVGRPVRNPQRSLGFPRLPHLADASNTDQGRRELSTADEARVAAALRNLQEQRRLEQERIRGAKAVVGSSVDPELDKKRLAAKLAPGVGALRAAQANLARKEKARQAKLEEEERREIIFGLRKAKKGASKGGSRRKRRGNNRVTKRR